MRIWALGGLCAIAAAIGSQALADVSAALKAIERRDYQAAVRELAPAAGAGDPDALYHLGTLYANGEGVGQSYEVARRMFEASAAKGDLRARQALDFLIAIGAVPAPPAAVPAMLAARPGAAAPGMAASGPGASGLGASGPGAPAAATAPAAPAPAAGGGLAAATPAPAFAPAMAPAAAPAAAPVPADAGAAAVGTGAGDWRLQLATVLSEEAAAAEARRLARRFQVQLAGLALTPERYQMPDGTVVFRVLSPPLLDQPARDLCQRIRTENGGCLLVKP